MYIISLISLILLAFGKPAYAEPLAWTTYTYGKDYRTMCGVTPDGIRCLDPYVQALVPKFKDHPTSIVAGDTHFCAMSKTEVKCWFVTKMARTPNDRFAIHELEQLNVPDLQAPLEIAAVDQYTCALDANLGLKCWGRSLPQPLVSNTKFPAVVAAHNPRHLVMKQTTACLVLDTREKRGELLCWDHESNVRRYFNQPTDPVMENVFVKENHFGSPFICGVSLKQLYCTTLENTPYHIYNIPENSAVVDIKGDSNKNLIDQVVFTNKDQGFISSPQGAKPLWFMDARDAAKDFRHPIWTYNFSVGWPDTVCIIDSVHGLGCWMMFHPEVNRVITNDLRRIELDNYWTHEAFRHLIRGFDVRQPPAVTAAYYMDMAQSFYGPEANVLKQVSKMVAAEPEGIETMLFYACTVLPLVKATTSSYVQNEVLPMLETSIASSGLTCVEVDLKKYRFKSIELAAHVATNVSPFVDKQQLFKDLTSAAGECIVDHANCQEFFKAAESVAKVLEAETSEDAAALVTMLRELLKQLGVENLSS